MPPIIEAPTHNFNELIEYWFWLHDWNIHDIKKFFKNPTEASVAFRDLTHPLSFSYLSHWNLMCTNEWYEKDSAEEELFEDPACLFSELVKRRQDEYKKISSAGRLYSQIQTPNGPEQVLWKKEHFELASKGLLKPPSTFSLFTLPAETYIHVSNNLSKFCYMFLEAASELPLRRDDHDSGKYIKRFNEALPIYVLSNLKRSETEILTIPQLMDTIEGIIKTGRKTGILSVVYSPADFLIEMADVGHCNEE